MWCIQPKKKRPDKRKNKSVVSLPRRNVNDINIVFLPPSSHSYLFILLRRYLYASLHYSKVGLCLPSYLFLSLPFLLSFVLCAGTIIDCERLQIRFDQGPCLFVWSAVCRRTCKRERSADVRHRGQGFWGEQTTPELLLKSDAESLIGRVHGFGTHCSSALATWRVGWDNIQARVF